MSQRRAVNEAVSRPAPPNWGSVDRRRVLLVLEEHERCEEEYRLGLILRDTVVEDVPLGGPGVPLKAFDSSLERSNVERALGMRAYRDHGCTLDRLRCV